MIRYVEAGHYPISYQIETGFPQLSFSQRQDLDQDWQQALNQNPDHCNQDIYCCHAFDNRQYQISLNLSTTAIHFWAHRHQLEIPGSRAIESHTLIFNPQKDVYAFAVHPDMAYYGGRISAASSGLITAPDYPVEAGKFPDFVDQSTYLDTEINLRPRHHINSFCHGLYFDSDTCQLSYLYLAIASGYALPQNGQGHLLEISAKQIHKFYVDNALRFEPSLQNHLARWSRCLSLDNFISQIR